MDREVRRNKRMRRIAAMALSVMVFSFNVMAVLAASYTTTDLLDGKTSVSFTPAAEDEIVVDYKHGMYVYINNAEKEKLGQNDSYTIPSGITGATLTNPAPGTTDKPLELRLTTPQANQVPDQKPGGGHECIYEWIVTLEPTLEEDGICSHMCEECGSVDRTQPVSRYQMILKEIEKKIAEAPQGAEIEVNYRFLECLPAAIIELIDGRPDLTIHVTFESNKKDYSFTIPKREEGNKIAEEGVEFYGFHYLGDKYGKKEIVN